MSESSFWKCFFFSLPMSLYRYGGASQILCIKLWVYEMLAGGFCQIIESKKRREALLPPEQHGCEVWSVVLLAGSCFIVTSESQTETWSEVNVYIVKYFTLRARYQDSNMCYSVCYIQIVFYSFFVNLLRSRSVSHAEKCPLLQTGKSVIIIAICTWL